MFDLNGNLPAGFHDWTIEEIKDRLVSAFPSSSTRPLNYAGLERLRAGFAAIGFALEQWVDGSFATSKLDPADVDMLNLMDIVDAMSLTATQAHQVKMLVAGRVTRASYRCDSYMVLLVSDPNHPEYNFWRERRKYWMGEFGFNRQDQPKGIVRTMLF